MNLDEQKPKINLKKYQRFRREVPWALIRKIVIVAILGGLIYYLANRPPQNHSMDDSDIEVDDIAL